MSGQAREYYKDFRRVRYAAQISIARVYKGHLAKRYVAWIRNFEDAAIQMQRVARGFICRCRFHHLRSGTYMRIVFEPRVVVVQKHIRGHLCRRWLKEFIRERLHEEVVVPCAGAIQRVFRGYQDRKIAQVLRIRRDAATAIQALVRGVLLRKEVAKIRLRILRHWMAVKIQRIARGFMTRRVFARRMEKKRRAMVIIPAATLIQAHIRGYLTRKAVSIRRRHWLAALKIQAQFRAYKGRLG